LVRITILLGCDLANQQFVRLSKGNNQAIPAFNSGSAEQPAACKEARTQLMVNSANHKARDLCDDG
jgi:hypothetical protein